MWPLYATDPRIFLLILTQLPALLGKRESSAKFETTAITPYSAENEQFAPLLVIECRGLEFTDFDPRVRTQQVSLTHYVDPFPCAGHLEMRGHDGHEISRG